MHLPPCRCTYGSRVGHNTSHMCSRSTYGWHLADVCSTPVQALIHGLNRHYYSISINYRKNQLEEQMLLNLQRKSWASGLTLR